MIISDGTTDIEVLYADEIADPIIDEDSAMSAGGFIKTQRSGKRFKMDVKIRASAAEYMALLNLLTNGSPRYYFTPNDTHGIYSDVTFPLEVGISDLKRSWDNRTYYYLDFTVESAGYI
jgi:hypothetical protein